MNEIIQTFVEFQAQKLIDGVRKEGLKQEKTAITKRANLFKWLIKNGYRFECTPMENGGLEFLIKSEGYPQAVIDIHGKMKIGKYCNKNGYIFDIGTHGEPMLVLMV